MKRHIVGVAAFSFVTLITTPLFAQQGFVHLGGRGGTREGGQGKYDPALAEFMSGEVILVKDVEFDNGNMTGVGMDLKTDNQTIAVYLGPHIYVDLQNVRINAGDKVEIKGVRTLLNGQQTVIAAEVRKGDEVLKLRDDNGVPLWAGKRQGGRRGN